MPRHPDPVAHPELTFDRDQARENSLVVFAFEPPLLAEPSNFVTKTTTNFRRDLSRPAVRNALRSPGIRPSTTAASAVTSEFWNVFNLHHLNLLRSPSRAVVL